MLQYAIKKIEPIKISRKPIPFRYPGGKFYALNLLAPYWLSCQHDEYREPFLGGGSVFFTKPKVKYNILNDIDFELITAYKIMQNPQTRSLLISKVENEIASPERWREIMNFVPTTDLEIAFKYFYLNRTSFSGKLSSAAWGYREKRSLPPERWYERISPCGFLLENTELFNLDFEKIIKMPQKGKNVLMFIDPPYYKPNKHKHYRSGFDIYDHIRLSQCLKETKYNFFLTYEDTPEIREIYSWANIFSMEFSYRVDNSVIQNGSRIKGVELIIMNFEPVKSTLF
ncbi:Modification methylase DpnIIA [termite gut metagenome]|uniref:Modification methylase DpnIIA n=1 Tax=termite gut metagenome TaxID=433724 RepID=A0A5J4QWW3_9ZZZZ